MSKLAIGVDFGGTKVLAGVIDVETGKVIGTGKKRTNSSDNGESLMKRIYSVCDDAMTAADVTIDEIAGIGVGIAGQVDADKGLLVGTANLSRSVVNLPMAKGISDRYGVRAEIRNDVQIAAVGEKTFGAGKGVDQFVCIFVGTGIGGAIIQHGELVAGSTNNAGELGHTTVEVDGRVCGCGGRGHLEAYASRTAITAALLGEMRRGHTSVLSDLLPDVDPAAPPTAAIRSGILSKAVKAQDDVAIRIVTGAGTYLGYAMASIVNFLNPELIILGGGLIEAVDLMFETADAVTRREAFPNAGEAVKIKRAALGDNSGVVGAAVIAAG
ncbi:MAG TPA: ROK family protein [Thermomicrobiales bacterium]|nr:ROK family protein [Thermomicrobiales bacterium]